MGLNRLGDPSCASSAPSVAFTRADEGLAPIHRPLLPERTGEGMQNVLRSAALRRARPSGEQRCWMGRVRPSGDRVAGRSRLPGQRTHALEWDDC